MFAAIDVGTNSVRLLVAEAKNRKINYVYKDIKTTRLGEGIQQTGELQENAIKRTVDALEEFQEIIKKFKVTKICAVATSAARDAVNGDKLIKKALEKGLELEIISGEKEALLSFKGATSDRQGISHQLVVDIGGGSTEIIYALDDKVISASTQAGAVRCTEGNWTEEQIKKALQPVLKRVISLPEKNLIGVGGTITSLAAIDQKLEFYNPAFVHGYKLNFDRVSNIRRELAFLNLEQRKQIKGLHPSRADIIVAGIDILLIIMSELNQDHLIVSEKDLLDGIIFELVTKS